MEQEYLGKFRIAAGRVMLEDPSFEREERERFLSEVIEIATRELGRAGHDEILPVSIAPARFDDDHYYFLHLTGGTETEQDGAFHFPVRCRDDKKPAKIAERMARSAGKYLAERDELVAKAVAARAELEAWFDDSLLELAQVAVLVDGDSVDISAEFTMLEFDLAYSTSRRTGSTVRQVVSRLERAESMHNERVEALSQRLDDDCDVYVDRSARILMDHCELEVEKVLDTLGGVHWIDIEFPDDETTFSIASLHIQDGVLMADMRDFRSRWELRGHTFVLPGMVAMPHTVRTSLVGKPLSRVLETGTVLDTVPIEGFDGLDDEVSYVQLALPREPWSRRKAAARLRAA